MLKSETILNEDIEREIRRAWHFMPYKVDYDGSSINRYSSEIDYECLACNAKIHTTFAHLEEMWDKHGYYCPYCCSSYNPVYEEKLPGELVENNKEFIPDLDAEYSIMSGIQEHLKCKPYGFKNINKGRSVRLQHKPCSTIFTATPSMLYKQFTIQDKYTGEPFTTPYCPKCNQVLEHEGISYGGVRFVERLHNWFADLKREFPYEFNEDDLYRFKDYDLEMIVTCAYCGHRFASTPNSLFTETGDSLCPVCGGKPRSEDSGEGAIDDLKVEETKNQLEQDQTQQQTDSVDNLIIESEEVADSNINTEPETFVDSIDKPISSDEVFEEEISQEPEDDESNVIPETNEEPSVVESNITDESEITVDEDDDHVLGFVEDPKTMKEEQMTEEISEEDLLAKYGSSDDDYSCNLEDVVDEHETEVVNEDLSRSYVDDDPEDIPSTTEDVSDEETQPSEEISDAQQSTSINDLTIEEVMKVEPTDIHQTSEIEDENISTESEDTSIEAVETDVDQLVDEIANPGLDLYEPENDISETQNSEIDQSDYPTDYEPIDCPVETPEFANPDIVDTPENRELIQNDEPQPETYEEMTQAMGEIIQDLNDETIQTEQQETILTAEESVEEDLDSNDETLGIPDTEPEDDDIIKDAEMTKNLMTALGEETPTKSSGDILNLGAPNFEQYQMRHPLDFGNMQPAETLTDSVGQTNIQEDIINKTIPDRSQPNSFVDDDLDIDWDCL